MNNEGLTAEPAADQLGHAQMSMTHDVLLRSREHARCCGYCFGHKKEVGQTLCFECLTYLFVELPGIEPGSYVESLGLLRVQFAKSLLGSPSLANKPG